MQPQSLEASVIAASAFALRVGGQRSLAVRKISADHLHCPAFLRLSIACRHPDVQAWPVANRGPRHWHALIQALRSQLTASAGAANMTDCPWMRAANMNASDNRRVMDDLPQIKSSKMVGASQGAH
jgi:hypothetical protein